MGGPWSLEMGVLQIGVLVRLPGVLQPSTPASGCSHLLTPASAVSWDSMLLTRTEPMQVPCPRVSKTLS